MINLWIRKIEIVISIKIRIYKNNAELHVNFSLLFISHKIANRICILHNEFQLCDIFLGMWPSILLFFNLYIHNVF